MDVISRAALRGMVGAIRLYQWVLSPLIGRNCRFLPSCSQYALQALERHGPAKGLGLTVGRLVRCHPFHPGGVDRVPGTGGGA